MYWQQFMFFLISIFDILMVMINEPPHDKTNEEFSRYFVDKVALLYKMPKSEKGYNSTKYLWNFTKT